MSPAIPPSSSQDIASPPPAARRRRALPQPGSDGHHVPRAEHRGAMPAMKISWTDAGTGYPLPMAKASAESKAQALEAATHLHRFDSWVRKRWNRAGWDDKGGNLSVIINHKLMGGNAYFQTNADGTGEMGIGVRDAAIGFKKSPAYSPSILFHEFVHGIVGTELLDMPKAIEPYLDQREHNAINESIADVISTGLLGTNWQNGQEIRDGSPLRDLADPSVPSWNPAVRKDGGLEEHTLSGIVSRAAVVAAESAGTLAVVDAWYAGIDKHYRAELMNVKAPFAGRALGAWVRATMRGAEDVGGKGSALVESMRAGWDAVGLGRYASDAQLERSAQKAPPKRRPKPVAPKPPSH